MSVLHWNEDALNKCHHDGVRCHGNAGSCTPRRYLFLLPRLILFFSSLYCCFEWLLFYSSLDSCLFLLVALAVVVAFNGCSLSATVSVWLLLVNCRLEWQQRAVLSPALSFVRRADAASAASTRVSALLLTSFSVHFCLITRAPLNWCLSRGLTALWLVLNCWLTITGLLLAFSLEVAVICSFWIQVFQIRAGRLLLETGALIIHGSSDVAETLFFNERGNPDWAEEDRIVEMIGLKRV